MTSFRASALEHDAAGCECLKVVLASKHDRIEPFRPASAITAVLGSILVAAYYSAHGTEVKSPGCDPPRTDWPELAECWSGRRP
jgi:hypothetical protein